MSSASLLEPRTRPSPAPDPVGALLAKERRPPAVEASAWVRWREGFPGAAWALWTNRPPESSQCGLDADFPSRPLQTSSLRIRRFGSTAGIAREGTATRGVLAQSPDSVAVEGRSLEQIEILGDTHERPAAAGFVAGFGCRLLASLVAEAGARFTCAGDAGTRFEHTSGRPLAPNLRLSHVRTTADLSAGTEAHLGARQDDLGWVRS